MNYIIRRLKFDMIPNNYRFSNQILLAMYACVFVLICTCARAANDEQPMDGQLVDEWPMAEQPLDEQPMDEQPLGEQPMEVSLMYLGGTRHTNHCYSMNTSPFIQELAQVLL